MRSQHGHDRVLYELIVDSDVVATDPATGRRMLKDRLYPGAEQSLLAAHNGLTPQLEVMSLTGDKWHLADLDRASIHALQAARGESSNPSFVKTIAAGWGGGDVKALPKRLITLLRTWLRAPIWLVPCPEGALLMLDWALSDRGRLSDVLGSLLDAILEFDIKTASKLR